MKLKLIILLFCCNSIFQHASAQFDELNMQSLHFNNSKPVRIFFTALWCSPCMGKYKKIKDELANDTSFNNLVLFDAGGFSGEKLNKIIPAPFDSLRSYILPYRYYKAKGLVAVNLSSKALARFIADLKKEYPGNDKLNFWFGDMLIISGDGHISMEKIKKDG